MSLETIVSVSISASSKTPTRQSFGIPMVAACKVPASWGDARVKVYGSNPLTEMVAAGFLTTDPAYKAVEILKSANPSVKKVIIGRRLLPPTKLIKLTVTKIATGYGYSFTVDGTAITYTVLAAATTTSVATALAALIDALPNVSATSSAAVITITSAAGTLFDVTGWYECGMGFKDDTVDPGLATDLAAIFAANSTWYAFGLDSGGKAENLAALAFAQSNKRLFFGDTSDTECADGGDTDDVCSSAQDLAYSCGSLWACNAKFMHYTSFGVIGAMLPKKPGSATFKFKTLPGVTPGTWSEDEKSALLAKNANTYMETAGVNITEEGKTPGDEWIDITWGIHWLESEIKTRVFALLINNDKVPYTNAGRDQVLGVIEGCLADAVSANFLAADPEPFATGPDVADVDSTTRGERLLPDLEFNGKLAGAIHATEIAGTLSV
jgi:hypothetical protein